MAQASDVELGFVVRHKRFRGIDNVRGGLVEIRIADNGHIITVRGRLETAIRKAAEALRRTE
jgi:hypothetical protein